MKEGEIITIKLRVEKPDRFGSCACCFHYHKCMTDLRFTTDDELPCKGENIIFVEVK